MPDRVVTQTGGRYCRIHGTKLVAQSVPTSFYRTDTGEREIVTVRYCPTCVDRVARRIADMPDETTRPDPAEQEA